ncbi:hypothetical protein GCM10028827_30030 [Mucilaginibacter myungsuensis]
MQGQTYDRSIAGQTKKWSYITALVSFTPVKFFNFTLGHDKNFIGDGYRSMLLSDVSTLYSFFWVIANVGNARYMAMWTSMRDRVSSPTIQRKWGVFHYLDWNVNNRLSFGFFDNVIWGDKDENGNKRGFDFTYLNPITFSRPLEASNGSPDNALMGLTTKYKISNGIAFYGPFALDEFEAKNFFSNNGSSRNKYGWQIGLRGANLFKIHQLNYLLEYKWRNLILIRRGRTCSYY